MSGNDDEIALLFLRRLDNFQRRVAGLHPLFGCEIGRQFTPQCF